MLCDFENYILYLNTVQILTSYYEIKSEKNLSIIEN